MIHKLAKNILLLLVLFLFAGVVMAQHDTGSGGTTGAATGGGSISSSSRGTTAAKRTPPRRTPPPRTTTRTLPPANRGMTAEQLNAKGDELFNAKNYDDALEFYQKAVALKPLAGAYYHLGWIYNDQEA